LLDQLLGRLPGRLLDRGIPKCKGAAANAARRGPERDLPFLKEDAAIIGQDGMTLEILVVALGVVVAEVSAAALGAGECGVEDGMGYAAHGLRFRETAAEFAVLRNFIESGVALGLGEDSPAER
jgi:hypothetical protein